MIVDAKKIQTAIQDNNLQEFKSLLIESDDATIKNAFSGIVGMIFNQKKVDFLQEFIQHSPYISTYKTPKGFNIAHLIALKNWQEAEPVLNLMDEKAFDQKDSRGFTPFYTACATASDSLWNFFFNHEKTIHAETPSNFLNVSPLYLATFSNDVNKVRDLLLKGISPNVKEDNGTSIIDVALEKKNWEILALLVEHIEILTPKFVLEAVKNFNITSDYIQSFIDNESLKQKIFPIAVPDRQAVWSYFFYYMSNDFLEKNQEFVQDYFIPDLNNNIQLKEVVFSIFLGKRDALDKFNWWMTFNDWKSFGEAQDISSVSTFNKDLTQSYAVMFDKFSNEELEKIRKTTPSWLNKISEQDAKILNLIYISRGLEVLIEDVNAYRDTKTDKFEKKKARNASVSWDEDNPGATYAQLSAIFNKIDKDVAADNFAFLYAFSVEFKIPSNVLYHAFVEDVKESSEPNQKILELNRNHPNFNIEVFSFELVKDILSDESGEFNHLLNEIELPIIQKSINKSLMTAFSDSKSNKKNKFKINNFKFDVSLEFNSIFSLTNLMSYWDRMKYSDNVISLLDKFVYDFRDIDKQQAVELVNGISIVNSVNLEAIERIKKIPNPLLKDVLLTNIFLQPDENLTEKAKEAIIKEVSQISDERFKKLIPVFAFCDYSCVEKTSDLIKVFKAHGGDLENYWNLVSASGKQIDKNFYLNTAIKLNDFDKFLDVFPIGSVTDVDVFKFIRDRADKDDSENLKDFLRNASGKIHETALFFSAKNVIFMGLSVFSYEDRVWEDKDIKLILKNINSTFGDPVALVKPENSMRYMNQMAMAQEFISLAESMNLSPDLMCKFFEESSLLMYSKERWFNKAQAFNLEKIVAKKIEESINDSDDFDVPSANSFKL